MRVSVGVLHCVHACRWVRGYVLELAISTLASAAAKKKGKTHTEWDLKFWCKLDEFPDFNYTTCGSIVSEALQ